MFFIVNCWNQEKLLLYNDTLKWLSPWNISPFYSSMLTAPFIIRHHNITFWPTDVFTSTIRSLITYRFPFVSFHSPPTSSPSWLHSCFPLVFLAFSVWTLYPAPLFWSFFPVSFTFPSFKSIKHDQVIKYCRGVICSRLTLWNSWALTVVENNSNLFETNIRLHSTQNYLCMVKVTLSITDTERKTEREREREDGGRRERTRKSNTERIWWRGILDKGNFL